VRYCPG